MDIDNKEDRVDKLLKCLRTPKDWNEIDDDAKASTLVLSFIGYVARPINIPNDILEKCVEAFNNNRGKIEIEIEAVDKVLKLTKWPDIEMIKETDIRK